MDVQLTVEPPNGRGCGKRSDGGTYACCGVSPWGKPIEYFLLDPVRPIPWQRGSYIIPRGGGSDLYDLLVYIGVDPKKGDTEGYPSTWSFIEEARRFGVSRKQSPNLQWHLLTPGESNMILAHPRAFAAIPAPGQLSIKTMHKFAASYELNREAKPLYGCKQFQTWVDHKDILLALGWEVGWDIRGKHLEACLVAEANGDDFDPQDGLAEEVPCVHALRDLAWFNHSNPVENEMVAGEYWIDMPSFKFVCRKPLAPANANHIRWETAAFAAIPLTHFEMPNGPQDEKGKEAVMSLRRAGFEVAETEW